MLILFVLKGIVELTKKGVYAGALIKKPSILAKVFFHKKLYIFPNVNKFSKIRPAQCVHENENETHVSFS